MENDLNDTINQDASQVPNIKQMNIRSDEVEDILSFIPHWIIRWGITVIFIVILIFLFVSWVIEYPDVISARISIITQSPPVSLVAKTNGKISGLFVKSNDWVKPNTVLAVLENPTVYEDYLELKNLLNEFNKQFNQENKPFNLPLNTGLSLGELQADYSDFQQKYLNYSLFRRLDYFPKKISVFERQIETLTLLQERLKSQKSILKQEVDISEKNYLTNKSLFEKGLLSEIDLTTIESVYLQKKYSLENAEAGILNNQIQIADYQQDILDYHQQYEEQSKLLLLGLYDSYKKLESAVTSWEQRCLLISPNEGRVSFYKFWSMNQVVNQNEEILSVVPSSGDMIGKIFLTGYGTGKIQEGQKVKIKFDGYPYHEFGLVNGYVESISLASHESSISVTVSLPNGLKTSYNKTLVFKQGMVGQAEIITDDLKLIERIFNQFRYLFTDIIKT